MKKILLVDDDVLVHHNVGTYLKKEGFQVFEAFNGEEGANLCKSILPNLIVSDIMMPKKNGHEMFEDIKSNPETSSIPFIFLTAKDTMEELREGMLLGADDYLPKPVDKKQLLKTVTVQLNKYYNIEEKANDTIKSFRKSILNSLPHEIFTPLNGILGFTSMLVDKYDAYDRDKVLLYLQNIESSSKRLNRTLKNYVLFVQLELDKPERSIHANHSPSSLYSSKDVISNVITEKTEKHGRSDDLDAELHEAHLDIPSMYLFKITEELFDNAINFSKKGTALTVKSFIEGDSLVITIRDGGRGMKPSEIEDIGAFVQFQREYYAQQGSGLGLVLAKRITELYHGTFEIKSEYEKFTEVRISFPITKQQ